MVPLTIGVLALQGCVDPHQRHLEALSVCFKKVNRTDDFDQVQGLILPGGESSTMLKLLEIYSLKEKLRNTCNRVPVWGICAGAILMAREVSSPRQESMGQIDISVTRNGYGRQQDSFRAKIENYPVSFIRAPIISSVGTDIEVKARIDGLPVWVRSGQYMATTFHPELTEGPPSPMHQHFVEMIRAHLKIQTGSYKMTQ